MRTLEMHFGAHRMRIAPVAAAAAILMLALLVSAGFWQLGRAEEKRVIAAEQIYRGEKGTLVIEPGLLATAALERLRHRRARASGRYRADKQYLLDNRTHRGVAGYHVLTPLRLRGSDVHVLVNRGWQPVGPDRARLPEITVSAQALAEDGLVVAPPASGLALGSTGYDGQSWPRVVQQVDLARMQAQLGAPLLPFVLRLSPDSANGYVREWHIRTGLTAERHVGYAVQWFALAAALLALCLWASVRREPEDDHDE